MSVNIDPQTIVGNEEYQAQIRALHPDWSEAMIRIAASVRGPITHDECPDWPHQSGGPWVRGLTADGKTCWV